MSAQVKFTSPFPSEVFPTTGYPQIAIAPAGSSIVTTSGQVGIDLSGNIVVGYEEQVQLAFKNLVASIASAGAKLENVLKVTFFVVDYDPTKIGAITQAMVATFGPKVPSNTLIGVAKLFMPNVLFEVEAVAAILSTVTPESVVSPPQSVDVVIVGAGMSGIQAAYDIHKAGLSYVVLESRDRVGGRSYSKNITENGVVDLGAAWINDTTQSEMYTLSKDLGLELIKQRATGLEIWQKDKTTTVTAPYGDFPFTEEENNILGETFSALHKINTTDTRVAADLDKLTFSEYISSLTTNDSVQRLSNGICRGLLGVESYEPSALWLVNYIKAGTGPENLISDLKDGGQYLRIRKGMQSFPEGLAARLYPESIMLSAAVTAITQSATGFCTVDTSSGHKIRCRKVIVSVPTTVYHKIQFNPPLPLSKQVLSNSTGAGYFSKIIFAFEKPWWREYNLSGIFNSDVGPISFTRDTSSDDDWQFSLTCFLVGTLGREWSILSKKARQESAWEHLRSCYGLVVKSIPSPINAIEQEWIHDPWVLGGPCPIMPVGALTSDVGRSLALPYQNVHFVGSETDSIWTGYMEGALRSGRRGAAEAIAGLKTS